MAELLKTKRIGSELEELFSTAKKYICIFTFNMVIDDIYISRLTAAGKRGVKITVVYGCEKKYKYDDDTLNKLSKIENCKVYFKEYLHAKFYYNENKLIVGSMNLSEVSEKKNYEIGVLLTRDKYPEVFEKIKCEAREIVEASLLYTKPIENNNPLRIMLPKRENNTVTVLRSFNSQSTKGKCIRCKENITHNPEKPFCYNCFQEWADWENEWYTENYCHTCGKKKEGISFAKPECHPCYTGALVL